MAPTEISLGRHGKGFRDKGLVSPLGTVKPVLLPYDKHLSFSVSLKSVYSCGFQHPQ